MRDRKTLKESYINPETRVAAKEFRELILLEILLDIRKLVIRGINRGSSIGDDLFCEECGDLMVQTRVYPERGNQSPTEPKCPRCEKVDEA